MYTLNSSQFACAAFLWPALVAESASEIASAAAREFANLAIKPQPQTGAREPPWTTQNCVALELPTVRLRDFSAAGEGIATLVCAPFALHGSTITDFAPGHSLVAALQGGGDETCLRHGLALGKPGHALSVDRQLSRRSQRVGG